MTKPIMVLKTGEPPPSVKSRHGDFEEWIARFLEVEMDTLSVISAFEGEPLPEASSLSGVVVTGSPAMVSDRPEWSESSAAWLAREIEADSVPILGLCYGHQLMAHGLGGEVGPNPNGREMGTVEVRFETTGANQREHLGPLFELGSHPAHTSHFEAVVRPPSDARVLATTELDPHHVLAFGPRQWGVQFHPEFDMSIMRRYVEARAEVLQSEGHDPQALIDSARETPVLNGLLRRFRDLTIPA